MAQHHSPTHGPGMGQTRRWARVLVPALIVLLWVAIAGVGGPLFGRIDEVSSNEPTAYLPESAESTEVSVLSREFYDSDEIPAVALIVSDDGVLSQSDIASVAKVVQGLGSLKGVGALSPPIPSEDGAAVQVFVPVDPSSDIADTVTAVRGALTEDLPNGLTPYVTGPAGLSADLVEAFGGIDGILLAVALLAVFIILLVVYRSLLLPLIVLITSLFALCGALATVWFMAREGLFLLNGQTQGILFILVIGAATDYSLLYVSRYRGSSHTERKGCCSDATGLACHPGTGARLGRYCHRGPALPSSQRPQVEQRARPRYRDGDRLRHARGAFTTSGCTGTMRPGGILAETAHLRS